MAGRERRARAIPAVGLAVLGLVLTLVAGLAFASCGRPARLRYPEVRPLVASVPAPVPRPGYLEPIRDPAFGTTVVRISDQAAFASSDQSLRNAYAKTEPWNADGSRLLLATRRPATCWTGRPTGCWVGCR